MWIPAHKKKANDGPAGFACTEPGMVQREGVGPDEFGIAPWPVHGLLAPAAHRLSRFFAQFIQRHPELRGDDWPGRAPLDHVQNGGPRGRHLPGEHNASARSVTVPGGSRIQGKPVLCNLSVAG